MNVFEYRQHRRELLKEKTARRYRCTKCLQPEFSCYCAKIKKIDAKIKFVILIHPIEVRRRIATGRMAHLCLENSVFLKGSEFSQNERLNEILQDDQYQPFVLYPGPTSLNLTTTPSCEKSSLFDDNKKPLIVVIDGTWTTAKKMLKRSQNLVSLPRICFTPPHLSQFRVRKQPRPECLSTIEAIHHAIEILGEHVGFDTRQHEHDHLISIFNYMVETQLALMQKARENSQFFARQPRPKNGRSSEIVQAEA